MVSPFFGPEIREDQQKSPPRKITGFAVQKRLETKQNEKTRFSPQISGVMVSHQIWNRSGFSRPDPTGKFQNLRRLTGRSTGFESARLTGF